MPLDLYGSNILGPGGNSGIRLDFFNASGCDGSMTATHAIRVVPTPGAGALLGLSGLIAGAGAPPPPRRLIPPPTPPHPARTAAVARCYPARARARPEEARGQGRMAG
jgi:hypothetical protein